MLLAIGLWVLTGGYTLTVWGQRVATGNPQTFAYLAGFSQNGTMDTSTPGPPPGAAIAPTPPAALEGGRAAQLSSFGSRGPR